MTLRRSFGVLALAGVLAGVTGCDDIIGANAATIIVENNATIVPVWNLYFSPCGNGTWGEDRLDEDETIAPGDSREFGVDVGCYDLRAVFSDASFAEDHGIQLDEGDEFTWELVD